MKLNVRYLLFSFIISGSLFGMVLIFLPSSNLNGNNGNSINSQKDLSLASDGFINESNQKVFWFIHVTDTQHIWYDETTRIPQWYQFLNETYKTVKPVIIYNTGDLVDSDYHKFFTPNERDQRIEEWERYNRSLIENNMNSSVYMDVIGNHDVYGDPGNPFFLKYSMMGQSYSALQYTQVKSFSFGDYAFIGLHTAEDYGAQYPFGLFGYLNSTELTWYENQLSTLQNCKKIFTFGHHPPFEVNSELSASGKSFFDLNKENNVSGYFVGHGHMNTFQNVNGMLAIETEKFDNNGGAYRIVSVDNDQLSTSVEAVGAWPQGLITYPPREDYINADIPGINTIRALAWDPKGITSVQWSAYDLAGAVISNWTTMTNATNDGPLYQATWNALLNDGKDYVIKIKIIGGSGESIREMQYSSIKSPYFGLYQAMPLFYILFFSLIGLLTLGTYYRRTHVPKYKKTKEKLVDKKLRNLYLLKCLIYLIVPLSFIGLYIGQVTAVFALFYLNIQGIYVNSLLFVFTGVLFLFSLFWQGFHLSYKKRKRLMSDFIFSLLILGFLIQFYIVHYPFIAWLSPGLYGMVIMDILMIQRSKERNIEFKGRIKPSKNEKIDK